MEAENWCRLNRAIETLKSIKGARQIKAVDYVIQELEAVLDRESDDDERPAIDD